MSLEPADPGKAAATEFSVASAIRAGWEIFKRRPWFFIGVTVILVLAHALSSAISSIVDVEGTYEDPTVVGLVVDYALGTLVDMGMVAFFLAAYAAPEAVGWSQLWHPRPYWKFLVTSFFVYLSILFGLLLLIVPGVLALVCFIFAMVIVIDRGAGPIDAMSESVRLTRGFRWQLLGLIAVQLLLIAAGVLALGVGFLVAVPVVMLSTVHAYRVLESKTGRAESGAATPRRGAFAVTPTRRGRAALPFS
jgi:hypothetical protein